ncbi:MAG: imidazolonepropionase [Rhodopirellula sp.]|nr:imidazolonepropionase [Rhodopirellula sp.]OUX50720.1 MAG: imidazolonepropionase [Rhodopirellula sp. TMED283]
MSGIRLTLAAYVVFAMLSNIEAHDQVPGAPQTRPIVIRNATVHVVDGPDIKNGDVLFEAGKITSVGKEIKVPKQTLEIDGSGKHLYPGLIESMTDLGLREISAVEETDDRTEYGSVNPNARAWVAVNPDSELIPVARAGGVLTVMTAPRGRYIRGQTAVINLDGWTVAEMKLKAPAGMYIDWGSMQPRGNSAADQRQKREQKFTELDELLDSVRRYQTAREAAPTTTATDIRLESLIPVINGELPVFVDADRQMEIESAVAYGQAQGLLIVVYGGYDAEQCAELLKKYDVPVIIASTYRLPLRRDEAYDTAYTLPKRLRAAGVKFAICGEGAGSPGGAANARNLPYHAGVAVAYGLPHSDGLRSITLSAAEILGVADRLGSISSGKDATLILADGNILETETNVQAAFIQGRAVDLGSRHKMLYEKYKLKYLRSRAPR